MIRRHPSSIVRLLGALLLAGAAGGCFPHGSTPADLRDVTGPHGASATIGLLVTRAGLEGELLEIAGDTLFLLRQGALVRVPLDVVARLRVGPHRASRGAHEPPSEALPDVPHLRLLARHPFGLGEDGRRELMRLLGQESMREVDATGAIRPVP